MLPGRTITFVAVLACAVQAQATSHLPTVPEPQAGMPIMITTVPTSERVLSIEHIDLLITTAPTPCTPGATGWGAAATCFEAVMPDGEVRQFETHDPFGIGGHVIDGYTYSSPGVITVEYVQTINQVSCMPVGPGGCHFHHYTLITE